MVSIMRSVAAASLLAMIASVGAFGTLPAVADEIQPDPTENSLVSDSASQVDMPENAPTEVEPEPESQPIEVVSQETLSEAALPQPEAVADVEDPDSASVSALADGARFGRLTWVQSAPGVFPSYLNLWSGTPRLPAWDCATVDDPDIHGSEWLIGADDPSVAFDLIQWTVSQNAGSATFDVAGSECGARWGITADDAMYVEYDPLQAGDAARAASVSFGPGTITIDVDALLLATDDDRSATPGPISIVRSDGLVISVNMWITEFAVDEPAPGSCFTPGPLPVDGYFELPALPDPYDATLAVGDAVHIGAADLVKESAWTIGYVNDISGLVGSTMGEPTEAGDNFSWTATAAGVHTFEYLLATPYCVSEARIGTITVTAAPEPTEAVPSPVVPDRLALTGSDSFPLVVWSAIALFLGIAFFALHHFGRREVAAEPRDD